MHFNSIRNAIAYFLYAKFNLVIYSFAPKPMFYMCYQKVCSKSFTLYFESLRKIRKAKMLDGISANLFYQMLVQSHVGKYFFRQ